MFEHDGDVNQRARPLITGSVVAVAKPVNALSGRRFLQVRVRTLTGELNIVAPEDAIEAVPSAPAIALADVWLVGRPVEPPPPRDRRGAGCGS